MQLAVQGFSFEHLKTFGSREEEYWPGETQIQEQIQERTVEDGYRF